MAARLQSTKQCFCAKGQSLIERHRYGAVARYRSDTGSEPNMTSGNSWEKRKVCGIDKIEIGTQLFEVKLCAACRTQQTGGVQVVEE